MKQASSTAGSGTNEDEAVRTNAQPPEELAAAKLKRKSAQDASYRALKAREYAKMKQGSQAEKGQASGPAM